jgi:hypothetical protein
MSAAARDAASGVGRPEIHTADFAVLFACDDTRAAA